MPPIDAAVLQPGPRARPGRPTGEDPPPDSLHLDAPALLVSARFRGVTLASRVMVGHPRAPTTSGPAWHRRLAARVAVWSAAPARAVFRIGCSRRADAPADPAALMTEPHVLVESTALGFAVNLSPAMRVHWRTPRETVALGPDSETGRTRAALSPSAGSFLQVACGEMVFEMHDVLRPPSLPARWISADGRAVGPYALALSVFLLALVGLFAAVPQDPKALSFELLDASSRLTLARIVPAVPPRTTSLHGRAETSAPTAPTRAGECSPTAVASRPTAGMAGSEAGTPAMVNRAGGAARSGRRRS
jgi:hypothetical protein